MGASSKVVNEREVIRWLEEGRTYRWIVEEYRRRYDVETTVSMWAAIRRRQGIEPRLVRDPNLVPWYVKPEHRHAWPVTMLRGEARRRAGKPLTHKMEEMVDAFIRGLKADNTVVHYDPETEEGWWYVPPRPGVDTDLIRVPDRVTGRRAGTSRDQMA